MVNIQLIDGTEYVGDSLSKINNNFLELYKFVAPSFTADEIANRSSEANTIDKEQGRIVYDSTNFRLMVATGAADNDTWYVADGTNPVTPQ